LLGSASRFTSQGKRELGHVVHPGGHVLDGQYVTSSFGSGAASGPPSALPKVPGGGSLSIPRRSSPTEHPHAKVMAVAARRAAMFGVLMARLAAK
jgi:hypothetical protein